MSIDCSYTKGATVNAGYREDDVKAMHYGFAMVCGTCAVIAGQCAYICIMDGAIDGAWLFIAAGGLHVVLAGVGIYAGSQDV